MKKLTFTFILSFLALGVFAQTDTEDVRYNQYGVRVSRTPMFAESRDGVMVFESKNQAIRFWFDIRVQIDGAFFFGEKDFMDPIGNGIAIRRARFAVKSQINRNWYGEIDTDWRNGDVEIKDALIRYNTCGWDFTLGNFKEDFSMEETTSSRYLPFMERPMVIDAFAPGRHMGFNIVSRYKWLYYSAGVHFQIIDSGETALNVQNNNKDYGRNQGVSFTGKLVFNPLYNMGVDRGIHIGGGASYRTPKTDVLPAEWGTSRFNTRNATAINRKKYLDTDLIKDVDHEFLWNAELAGHYQGFRFQGEYVGNNVYVLNSTPLANRSTKTFKGWYAMAGYLLFGGKQQYNMNETEFTQPSRGRHWGDVELLFRYDFLDLNSKNIRGGAGQNYTVGVNYYINNNVKFVVNYQYSDNDRYANGKGKNYIGRDVEGKPTANYANVVAAKGKGGVSYHMLGMRMEIDF